MSIKCNHISLFEGQGNRLSTSERLGLRCVTEKIIRSPARSLVLLSVGYEMVSQKKYMESDNLSLNNEKYLCEMKVCRNTRCAFFFFIDYKNRLIFLSCDILRISLVYVFATSK